MPVNNDAFPTVAYVGDVPVEASYHGSLLLFRLFEKFDAAKIVIVESGPASSLEARRLVNVKYRRQRMLCDRLLSTRVARWYSTILLIFAHRRAGNLRQVIAPFNPEAIVTVAHGYSWITAFALANAMRLPLHLICHDDCARTVQVPIFVRCMVESKFAHVYRSAASRLCISPYMVEEYKLRYNTVGAVMYPARSANSVSFPEVRLRNGHSQLVYGFGGTINSNGYIDALRSLAKVLEASGDLLHIYGPLHESDARRLGLGAHNVRIRGLVPSGSFISVVRAEVDVLFVPSSFVAAERMNTILSFPSKLTDYTAAGLPILVYGPVYASVVRWAKDHPGVAEIVDSADAERLSQACARLRSPETRRHLAEYALTVGAELFSHSAAYERLLSSLRTGGADRCSDRVI